MASNLRDVTDQSFDFPAAASGVNESSSIFLTNLYELIGLQWEALEQSSAKVVIEAASVNDAAATSDSGCTWYTLNDAGGDPILVVEAFDTAGQMAFSPDSVLWGPRRIRLAVFESDGATPVNQDGQKVYPVLRSRK